MPLAIVPVPVLTPAQIANLSELAAAIRAVQEAHNDVVRQAQLLGRVIQIEDRAAKYKSPVLRITEAAGKTPIWKAAALAELTRQERNARRETHRVVRRVRAAVATVVKKRKTRERKRRQHIPSPPHKQRLPHSSDEDNNNNGGAGAAAAK